MSEKKKIPCRVCGKLFEPCAYCQAHDDVFRWRNFACSKECATKYINDTKAYRESFKKKNNVVDTKEVDIKQSLENASDNKTIGLKKKTNKKNPQNIDNEIKNNETE